MVKIDKPQCKSNQIFHYSRCITLKRITSLHQDPSPRHCARATLLLSKKCRISGERLATLSDRLARDLSSRSRNERVTARTTAGKVFKLTNCLVLFIS